MHALAKLNLLGHLFILSYNLTKLHQLEDQTTFSLLFVLVENLQKTRTQLEKLETKRKLGFTRQAKFTNAKVKRAPN
jgi:hypothetical protein